LVGRHNPSVAAVVVDDGEPYFERSLQSLHSQTHQLEEIIVVPGPKGDLELAKELADRVLEPTRGIGDARVKGVLAAKSKYVVSADSDTIYDKRYVEFAVQSLEEWGNAVRAATILPLEWTPLAVVETLFSLVPPYEFSFVFRRKAFLDAGIHLQPFRGPRDDIGPRVVSRLWPRLDGRMVCWTRFPSEGAKTASMYGPSALAGLMTVVYTVAVPAANELSKFALL